MENKKSKCIQCDGYFSPTGRNKVKPQTYCSVSCAGKSRCINKLCKMCGDIIDSKGGSLKPRVYCSRVCAGKACQGTTLSKEWRKALSDGRKNSEKCKGPNLYNWKGGKETLLLRMKSHNSKRRSLLSKKIDIEFLKALFIAQRGRCFYCEKSIIDYKEVEHLTPVSKGGDNQNYNIVYSCRECNSKKRAKKMEDWAIETGNIWWIDKFDIIYAEALCN